MTQYVLIDKKKNSDFFSLDFVTLKMNLNAKNFFKLTELMMTDSNAIIKQNVLKKIIDQFAL